MQKSSPPFAADSAPRFLRLPLKSKCGLDRDQVAVHHAVRAVHAVGVGRQVDAYRGMRASAARSAQAPHAPQARLRPDPSPPAPAASTPPAVAVIDVIDVIDISHGQP